MVRAHQWLGLVSLVIALALTSMLPACDESPSSRFVTIRMSVIQSTQKDQVYMGGWT